MSPYLWLGDRAVQNIHNDFDDYLKRETRNLAWCYAALALLLCIFVYMVARPV